MIESYNNRKVRLVIPALSGVAHATLATKPFKCAHCRAGIRAGAVYVSVERDNGRWHVTDRLHQKCVKIMILNAADRAVSQVTDLVDLRHKQKAELARNKAALAQHKLT